MKEETNTCREVLEKMQEATKCVMGTSDENRIIGVFGISKWMDGGVGPGSISKYFMKEGVKIRGKCGKDNNKEVGAKRASLFNASFKGE